MASTTADESDFDDHPAVEGVEDRGFAHLWDQRIRAHEHRVFLSLLAVGIGPARAREIVQATWTRLMEKDRAGELREVRLPGLAIAQARFLARDDGRRSRRREHDILEDHPELTASAALDPERVLIGRDELERALRALGGCPPVAQRIFRMRYGQPSRELGEIAEQVGLSLQRVKQVLSETRRALRDALEETR